MKTWIVGAALIGIGIIMTNVFNEPLGAAFGSIGIGICIGRILTKFDP